MENMILSMTSLLKQISLVCFIVYYHFMYYISLECANALVEQQKMLLEIKSLDKIEEIEIERANIERKEKKDKLVRKTVENYKKLAGREEEDG